MSRSFGTGVRRLRIQGLRHLRRNPKTRRSDQHIDVGQNAAEFLLDQAPDPHRLHVVARRKFGSRLQPRNLFLVGELVDPADSISSSKTGACFHIDHDSGHVAIRQIG